MEKRDEGRDEAVEVIEAFEDHDLFGGLALGEHLGDPVAVNIVGRGREAAQLRRQIRSMFSNNDQLRFNRVEHSLTELRTEADLIFEQIASSELSSFSVAVDERKSLVAVEVSNLDMVSTLGVTQSNHRIDVEYELVPALVTENACTSRFQCGSGVDVLRGGLLVDETPTNGVFGGCSTGFVFELRDGSKFVSTAGHCALFDRGNGNIGYSSQRVSIGGEMRGSAGFHHYESRSNLFTRRSNADAVLIEIGDEDASNFVFRTNRTTQAMQHPIKQRHIIDNHVVGDRVCTAAVTVWFRCGQVTNTSVTSMAINNTVNRTIVLLDQLQWQFSDNRRLSDLGGSSGGPLFDGAVAIGTHARSVINTPLTGPSTYTMLGSKIGNIQQGFRTAGYENAQVRVN